MARPRTALKTVEQTNALMALQRFRVLRPREIYKHDGLTNQWSRRTLQVLVDCGYAAWDHDFIVLREDA